MGMVPDVMISRTPPPEPLLDAMPPNFLKTGLRTGRQALMTPRRASREVRRAMME